MCSYINKKCLTNHHGIICFLSIALYSYLDTSPLFLINCLGQRKPSLFLWKIILGPLNANWKSPRGNLSIVILFFRSYPNIKIYPFVTLWKELSWSVFGCNFLLHMITFLLCFHCFCYPGQFFYDPHDAAGQFFVSNLFEFLSWSTDRQIYFT